MADPNSLSNTDEYHCSHLDWNIDVDFSRSILSCKASYQVECMKDNISTLDFKGTSFASFVKQMKKLSTSSQIFHAFDSEVEYAKQLDRFCPVFNKIELKVGAQVLDTSDLTIEYVTINNENVPIQLKSEVKPFGKPLEISVPRNNQKKGSKFTVFICYKTSPYASAIQWLPPEQTLGKKHPYLFTQCQAIHARSLIPCQDSPGNKFTYSAKISVPKELVALMSAVKGEEKIVDNKIKICSFTQKVPIPSYLMAIAIGSLENRVVGPRSKVWCEEEMIEACAYEFAELENMLSTAESLLGPYIWGDYDLLVLPPSFPYGGMENPCLTFATPSVVAGDRSLTSVAIHEITHSWTGNLVTNKTWEHFWLNEGFTRFIEGKIVGLLEGEQMRQMMATDGWQHLIDSIETFGPTNKLTNLQPCLTGINPDDAFSSVPYEKGYAFLYYIESLVGGPDIFNVFLKSYVNHFKFKAIVTEDFKQYLLQYFKDKNTRLNEIDWNAWLFTPGMPPVQVCDFYDKTPTLKSKELCTKWTNAKTIDDVSTFDSNEFSTLKTLQKIDFLAKLYQEKTLELPLMKKLDELYDLQKYNNAEVKFIFLRLAVRSKWEEMYEKAIEFVLKLGRMKFVRPIYREMYKNEDIRERAIKAFQENRHIYNSITAKMVAKDLMLISE